MEYAETPIGIDVERPRFSWQMFASDGQRGCKQTAYQLVVTDESGHTPWNSGKMKSDVSLNVEYKGKPLSATTRYHWVVDIWDQNNKKYTAKSWFETGLMNPGLSAWSRAKWIGGSDDDMGFFAPISPFLKSITRCNWMKRQKQRVQALSMGANDMRLMDQYNFGLCPHGYLPG